MAPGLSDSHVVMVDRNQASKSKAQVYLRLVGRRMHKGHVQNE